MSFLFDPWWAAAAASGFLHGLGSGGSRGAVGRTVFVAASTFGFASDAGDRDPSATTSSQNPESCRVSATTAAAAGRSCFSTFRLLFSSRVTRRVIFSGIAAAGAGEGGPPGRFRRGSCVTACCSFSSVISFSCVTTFRSSIGPRLRRLLRRPEESSASDFSSDTSLWLPRRWRRSDSGTSAPATALSTGDGVSGGGGGIGLILRLVMTGIAGFGFSAVACWRLAIMCARSISSLRLLTVASRGLPRLRGEEWKRDG
uniref:Uncharacterized protein n=1 Tax=Ixodes ricinus TaxID=34613 RepID=A0A6B0V4N7_IXORI